MITGCGKLNKQSAIDIFTTMSNQNVNIERQHITTIFNICNDSTLYDVICTIYIHTHFNKHYTKT